MRVCEASHPTPRPTECRLCWLAINDGDYQRLWGLPVTAPPKARRIGKAAAVSVARPLKPLPVLRTDCRHLGPIIEYCTKCGPQEARHVRECDIHERCTLGRVSDDVRSCANCEHYEREGTVAPSIPGPTFPIRFDEDNLAVGVPGRRFNSSLINWGNGYALAWRSGWAGSEIYISLLDDQFRECGPAVRLHLRHRDAAYGREDPRLFMHRGKLHVEFIGVIGSKRAVHTNVLYARLSDDLAVEAVFSPRLHGRAAWEKNWGFFSHADTLYAVYSIAPHRVIRFDGERAEWVYETPTRFGWKGGEMRGGASPVLVGGEFWSFFHDRIEDNRHRIYRMGLYTFDAMPPFAPRRIIPDPLLVADRRTKPGDQYCSALFPCGAVRQGDRWIVSSGEHDRWTRLDEFSHAELERRLVAVR